MTNDTNSNVAIKSVKKEEKEDEDKTDDEKAIEAISEFISNLIKIHFLLRPKTEMAIKKEVKRIWKYPINLLEVQEKTDPFISKLALGFVIGSFFSMKKIATGHDLF